jgi:hypothetical protein
MIRPAPGLPLTAFRRIVDIPPIVRLLPSAQEQLRQLIVACHDEQVVVIGFGGINLQTLPFDALERLNGYRFVVSGSVPPGYTRIRSIDSLPMPFGTLLASADLLVTKPGYSTVVEAVALGKPVTYVRRHNFADEATLVEYLHRYGRAVELSVEDFRHGSWHGAFDAVKSLRDPPPSPAPTGAREAAELLMEYLDA